MAPMGVFAYGRANMMAWTRRAAQKLSHIEHAGDIG